MPAATSHHLAVPRTARYSLLGEPSAATRRVWFVCHGYGQLAAYFIQHFRALAAADASLLVVAPEGLSRFYLQGTEGRVGASWMTRDDRQNEITDQINFLNQLAGNILSLCAADVHITVLGFSQGTATAGRWLAQAAFRPHHLVLWAGTFPPDLAPATAINLLQGLPLTLVVGDHDAYITPTALAQETAYLRQLGSHPKLLTFSGKHELNQEIISQLTHPAH